MNRGRLPVPPPLEVRIVRLVTSVAKHPLRVRHRIDLGKSLGLRSVFFVAAAAEVGDIGQLGNIATFGLHMFRLGTVAGLASHPRMLSRVMHFGFGIVAEGALASARIGDRRGGDHVQRSRPVVSVFAKVFGYHDGANNQEDHHSGQQNQGRTNQVSRISEDATQCHPQIQMVLLSALTAGQGPPQASLCLTGQYWDQRVSLSLRLIV